MKIFLWFCLWFLTVCTSMPSAGDDEPESQAATSQAVIVLDKAAQAASGLKTSKLTPVAYRSELLSYGTAISIEPLVAIQNQYLTALSQQNSAQAKARFTQNSVNRLTYLHHEQIISTRALQEQQAVLQADKAALNSSHYLSLQIINNARLLWGTLLTDWIISANSAFTALMQQRTTLLKITFPTDSSLTGGVKTIFVAPGGHREQAVAAELISPVPQADAFSQGQQYFYQTPSRSIKTGMRVSAWIPMQQHAQSGVIIPESALCWHLGQALVFVKMSDRQFSHRTVSAYSKIAGGYFVSSGLKAGDEIVSTGAQMLLSQEFRGQIPNEDDE